ncbi:MAG: serine hydrolase [Patescibacteria group bacterium]
MKKVKRFLKLFKIIDPKFTIGFFCLILIIALIVYTRYFQIHGEQQIAPILPVASVFEKLALEAKAVYVYDVKENRALYSLNGDAQLPLASLTKVMMAVTALSLLPENAIVTIHSEFLNTEGDSGLLENERFSLKNLLDLTLLESSNDGASAIASVAGAVKRHGVPDSLGTEEFIKAMNETAKKIGMTQAYFLNPTGLDQSPSVSGGYGSAKDMTTLFAYAVKTYPTLLDSTRKITQQISSLDSQMHDVHNTNVSVSKIPSLLASKTGFTDLAGGNLTIVFDAGIDHPIVVSVLGSTEEGRFLDVEKLVYATLDYLNQN